MISMLALGLILGLWNAEPVPVFRSDFILYNEEETTCGGTKIVCGIPNPITRKPTPFVMRSLGLAPPKGDSGYLPTSADFQFDAPLMMPADFSDDMEFGSGQSICGSEH